MAAVAPARLTGSQGRALGLGGLLVLAFGASVAAPLFTYTTTLALFGLAHVATELRYVDARFGRRLGRRVLGAIVALLGCVVLLRLAAITGLGAGLPLGPLELVLGCLLCLTVLPSVAAGRWLHWRVAIAVAVTLALGLGVAVAPAIALLALAVLHNVTPVGFLAEALRGRERAVAMIVCAVVFAALPALILSGAPVRWLAQLGWLDLEGSWLPAGPLASHFGAYLPKAWHLEPWALHAFSAVVFLQCAHYVAVIGVLPTLQTPDEPLLRWPRWPLFALAIAGVSGLLLIHFWASFGEARAWYGVAAAVHAWVEIPLLLLALAPALAATARPEPT